MDENLKLRELGQKELAIKFLESLQKEQSLLPKGFPICRIVIDEAFDRFYSTGVLPGEEIYADMVNEKPISLSQKVFVPSKILSSEIFLKNLKEETQCNIIVKRKNSMDVEDEEKKQQTGELKSWLEVSALSLPVECYSRIAHALEEIRKYLISDQNDRHLHTDLDELEIGTEVSDKTEYLSCDRLAAEHLEDPLQYDNFKGPILPTTLLDEQQVSENIPVFNIANNVIQILDETVLNLNFKCSEGKSNETNAQTITNTLPLTSTSVFTDDQYIARNVNAEIQSDEITKKYCGNPDSKLVIAKAHTKRRRQNQGLINSNKMKIQKDKQLSIQKRKIKNTLKVKKENFPGIFYLKHKQSNKIIKQCISNKSALYRCLRICKTDSQESDNYEHFTLEFLQQNPCELVFEYTPRDVIFSFLEGMKNYPVLWEFHDKPYNENYRKATEDLCQIMNEKWSLNIDYLKMRRSISRVLRFYRYLFPFECIEKFTDYFDKCGVFLPSDVTRIPHARCSHCFICYKEDFELKKHLFEEQKSLKWRYKCQYCAESFCINEDFQFHKRLPHYVEVFTCDNCHKRFRTMPSYNKHLETHREKSNEILRSYMCDECGKGFKSNGELRHHKLYHGQRRYKCHICQKSYFKNTFLMLHLKSHRKELDFICEMCGAGFISEAYLKNHIETHMGIQVICNICGLKLRRHNLSRHLRTIHVACEGTIADTFRAKGHRHNQRHGQVPKRTFNPEAKRAERSKESHSRQYDCKTCNIPFDRLKFLKKHNQQFHSSNVQKVSCKICNSELSQNGNLRRHYQDIHKLDNYQVYAVMVKNEDINIVLEKKSEFLEEFIEKFKKQKFKKKMQDI